MTTHFKSNGWALCNRRAPNYLPLPMTIDASLVTCRNCRRKLACDNATGKINRKSDSSLSKKPKGLRVEDKERGHLRREAWQIPQEFSALPIGSLGHFRDLSGYTNSHRSKIRKGPIE